MVRIETPAEKSVHCFVYLFLSVTNFFSRYAVEYFVLYVSYSSATLSLDQYQVILCGDRGT